MAPAEQPIRVTSRISYCFGPNEHRLSRPVGPPPSHKFRDFSPPPPCEDEALAARSEVDDLTPDGIFSGSAYSDCPRKEDELHEAVWLADRERIDALLSGSADVNSEDTHGVTPLMLAVELMPRSSEYFAVVQCLLQRGGDPRLRSSWGWSPLDEAVSRGDGRLVRVLFQAAQKDLRQRWDARLSSVAKSLELLPDFECRIRWEFESPVIPLLNKIAPSDVLHIRKKGNCLRLDSTLASWKRYRFSKRRNLTTLFRGSQISTGDALGGRGLFMINHGKQTLVDVTQGLDGDEAAAVVEDLMKADAMQWDMSITSLDVAESTTWLGGIAGPCDVNGWSCLRYDVSGELGMTLRKKGCRIEGMTYQQYFGRALPADACLPELRQEFEGTKQKHQERAKAEVAGPSSNASGSAFNFADEDLDSDAGSITSEVLDAWPGEQGALPPAAMVVQATQVPTESPRRPSQIQTRDKLGKTSKSVSGSVWLATDFAISMDSFLPVMEALAAEHDAMRRLKEIVESESLKEAAKRARLSAEEAARTSSNSSARRGGHVFPVRASVPINLAIRAIVHFESFKLLPPEEIQAEVFQMPEGYRLVSRSEAQKTPNRAKKRMLIANLAL